MEPIRTGHFVGQMEDDPDPEILNVGVWRDQYGDTIKVEPMTPDDAAMMRRVFGAADEAGQ